MSILTCLWWNLMRCRSEQNNYAKTAKNVAIWFEKETKSSNFCVEGFWVFCKKFIIFGTIIGIPLKIQRKLWNLCFWGRKSWCGILRRLLRVECLNGGTHWTIMQNLYMDWLGYLNYQKCYWNCSRKCSKIFWS